MKLPQRRALAVLALLALVLAAVAVGVVVTTRHESDSLLQQKLERGDQHESSQAGSVANGDESAELMAQQQEFTDERTAPTGVVDPAGYGAGYTALKALAPTTGSWSELTNKPYDADDPNYRDYYSNSGGGSGLVTGRITGIAADGKGDVYAAGANGGVWRSTTGGGHWTPIADNLPSLSTGTLQLATDGSLWYATGEANTGATAFVGDGVYRLANPTSGTFSVGNKVGGNELDGATIGALRFTRTRVWAATSRGLYWHSLSGSMSAPWQLSFAPNPDYLSGGSQGSNVNGYVKNIVNDVAVDPKDENHVIAAAAWRSGDSYNGFYETHNATAANPTWTKVNPTGAIPATDIGYTTFAYAADGSKLYAINQSPALLNKATGTVNSYLDGIYVSNSGDPAGPWSKIADSQKLANSGSALKQSVGGKGYGPGIQSWYNQFLVVDPQNANHVYAGLEEVYETTDGGSNWSTVGPYWNFYFSCWSLTALYPPDGTGSCPQTTHPDQHSVAIGTYKGTSYVYVGNDGGIYRRPVNGTQNADGHATDWQSLNDGSIDALQYYSVSEGPATQADVAAGNVPSGTKAGDALISGGMQDNGGSILGVDSAVSKMSSNFGGDGGDSIVDPANGCNIVQEYVDLAMEVTNDCAHSTDPQQFIDPSKATTWSIAPPEVNARFIAPFTQDTANTSDWLAGGASLWYQSKGYAIRSGSEWTKVHTWGSPVQVTTAVSLSHGTALAAWCGPCNTGGFARGAAVGTVDAQGNWTWTDVDLDGSVVPNRYISSVAVDPSNQQHMVLVASGFSRRFAEGPGAGVNHVFESTDGGKTWHALDGSGAGSFPDIPTNSVVFTPKGGIAVGTDLGVVYLAKSSSTWQQLGSGLPATVAMQLKLGPDGLLYAATHGRGLWRITAAGL